ncbi:uncharacterized protein MONOS_338 [Monocercomonoides exilis]|uniref:uncharacterized protein n=1 Tax=Monocercomonoides exilis TaxID=2049356 RepID=UPI003559645D|nr:hypothetical protein MONOS_338 [Monocercomonoides exilis]|eukprot:MONOS_338.1-p1 / transcript=MONOS_338.1 / gene=MONOS_338 / organism=Monocercomonoides_exilis_PA203 / gene_product=hypothetical protein / transcript_product=hypothetical protein / location=Mono_scaffold00005:261225-263283(+) / protein_length=462 / sequence_SO=supercontig / SO=protein_coding / is_pseudo=false
MLASLLKQFQDAFEARNAKEKTSFEICSSVEFHSILLSILSQSHTLTKKQLEYYFSFLSKDNTCKKDELFFLLLRALESQVYSDQETILQHGAISDEILSSCVSKHDNEMLFDKFLLHDLFKCASSEEKCIDLPSSATLQQKDDSKDEKEEQNVSQPIQSTFLDINESKTESMSSDDEKILLNAFLVSSDGIGEYVSMDAVFHILHSADVKKFESSLSKIVEQVVLSDADVDTFFTRIAQENKQKLSKLMPSSNSLDTSPMSSTPEDTTIRKSITDSLVKHSVLPLVLKMAEEPSRIMLNLLATLSSHFTLSCMSELVAPLFASGTVKQGSPQMEVVGALIRDECLPLHALQDLLITLNLHKAQLGDSAFLNLLHRILYRGPSLTSDILHETVNVLASVDEADQKLTSCFFLLATKYVGQMKKQTLKNLLELVEAKGSGQTAKIAARKIGKAMEESEGTDV